MPLPVALGIAAASAVKRAIAKKRGGGKGAATGKRRRRRARLTRSDLLELQSIANMLGKTAAANAMPYYLGRGRG